MCSDPCPGTDDYAQARRAPRDSDDEAQRLARGLVEARLAACVQIVGPVRSVFRREGAVRTEPEFQLVVKTAGVPEATDRIVANHPSDVPEVIALPIDGGHETYLTWVAHESSG